MSKQSSKVNSGVKKSKDVIAKEPQLTNLLDYDVNNIILSELQLKKIPNSNLGYKSITVRTRYDDGTIGDLIFPSEKCFSFGVSINTDPNTKKVNGHSLSLCLWSRDGTTDNEKRWSDKFQEIIAHLKKELVRRKEEYELYDLVEGGLTKFDPMYWKKEKGKVVPGTGPVLYPKLIEVGGKKKKDEEASAEPEEKKILSMITDSSENPIPPLSLIGKYGHVEAAIKIESIYISGTTYKPQVKLYQAVFDAIGMSMKPLLARPKPKELTFDTEGDEKKEDEEAGGSLPSSPKDKEDEEDEQQIVPIKPALAARKPIRNIKPKGGK